MVWLIFKAASLERKTFHVLKILWLSNCLICFQSNRFEWLFALAHVSSLYVLLLAEILYVTWVEYKHQNIRSLSLWKGLTFTQEVNLTVCLFPSFWWNGNGDFGWSWTCFSCSGFGHLVRLDLLVLIFRMNSVCR